MNRFQTLLSNSACAATAGGVHVHGRHAHLRRGPCGPRGRAVQVARPVLKAPMVSALETRISYTAFDVYFQFQLAPLHRGPRAPHLVNAFARGSRGSGRRALHVVNKVV